MTAQPSASKARVLLAAVRHELRKEVLCVLASRDDVVVIQAEDGSAALMLANIIHPQLLLLEAALPIHSGFVVCDIVKQSPALTEIPVVLLDVDTDQANQYEAAVSLCDASLSCGWEAHQLHLTIDRLLHRAHILISDDPEQ